MKIPGNLLPRYPDIRDCPAIRRGGFVSLLWLSAFADATADEIPFADATADEIPFAKATTDNHSPILAQRGNADANNANNKVAEGSQLGDEEN